MVPNGVVCGVPLGQISKDGAGRPQVYLSDSNGATFFSLSLIYVFLASQGWILDGPRRWVWCLRRLGTGSPSLSHALSPSPFAGTGPEKTPQSCPDPGRRPPGRVGGNEVALPSFGFESCMASAFRTQRESLLDWRAEAEPMGLLANGLFPVPSSSLGGGVRPRSLERQRERRAEQKRDRGGGEDEVEQPRIRKPSAEPMVVWPSLAVLSFSSCLLFPLLSLGSHTRACFWPGCPLTLPIVLAACSGCRGSADRKRTRGRVMATSA